jgi:hypothetical protein
MYYTNIDPFTKLEVYVARGLRDRKMQRALMQFFKPANWFTVREALIKAVRADLIGSGCDCLIPAQPPKEAIEARRRRGSRLSGERERSVSKAAAGRHTTTSTGILSPRQSSRSPLPTLTAKLL